MIYKGPKEKKQIGKIARERNISATPSVFSSSAQNFLTLEVPPVPFLHHMHMGTL